jgi:acetyltransferase
MSDLKNSRVGNIATAVPTATRESDPVLLRPVVADDAELVQSFVRALSPQSRRSRFLCGLTELPRYLLQRLTQPAYPKEFGLLAVASSPEACSVVGMAQYASEAPGCAEFSVAVADAWQRQGLGKRLVEALIDHAFRHGVETLCAVMLAENRGMLTLAERLGVPVVGNPEPGLVRVERRRARSSRHCTPGMLLPAWG